MNKLIFTLALILIINKIKSYRRVSGTLSENYFSYTVRFSSVSYAMNECNRVGAGCTGFSQEGKWWVLKKGGISSPYGISYIKWFIIFINKHLISNILSKIIDDNNVFRRLLNDLDLFI